MHPDSIPEFAIVGHPNEGKSSVLSTLAEDDSVRVSATPGETVVCQLFPVVIDDREIIRFIDTPGFQNPKKILHKFKQLQDSTDNVVAAFLEQNSNNPEFRDDCELLRPITKGAGIIYVVDGSRPLRNVDKAEMEILRLTGLPRMAIINSKDAATDFLEQWKDEFRKCFNVFRVFNAHTANYAQRIELLESLKHIDQDWSTTLETVITAFKDDWSKRNQAAAGIITELLRQCLSYKIIRNISDGADEERVKKNMQEEYEKNIRIFETRAHKQIRSLFKHNIFNYEMPAQSILHQDLFSESTWTFLGLTRNQQIAAAGIGGATLGAALDAAAAGVSFGIFSAIGGLAGAGWAAFSGDSLAEAKILGVKLGGQEIQTGPNKNIQFLYVLLDRSLIYYSHIINWAHGRRNYETGKDDFTKKGDNIGYTSRWNADTRKICQRFFDEVAGKNSSDNAEAEQQMKRIIVDQLHMISTSDQLDSF